MSAEESVEKTWCDNFTKDSLMPVKISLFVLSAHIIVASMEILGMQNVTDTPSKILIPPDVLKKTKDDRKEVLDHVVGVIINTFVDITTVKFSTPQTPDSDADTSYLSHSKEQACQNDEGE